MPQPTHQDRSLTTAVPGPRSRALRERESAHLAPGTQGYAIMAGIAVDHAEGSTITDVDDNTYIDLIGGIGVGAIGHSHPTWVQAIGAQATRATVGSLTSDARVDLLERFAEHPPAPGFTACSSTPVARRPSRARSGSRRRTPASTRS